MPSAVLLTGGRVIDPDSSADRVADVLVVGDTVSEVAATGALDDAAAGHGAERIDVTGLIVGPGFVDLHSHVHSVAGQRLQAFDAVTTALDLESGLMPIERGYAEAARIGRPLNYGFSASWSAARGQVLAGIAPDATLEGSLGLLADPRWQRTSSTLERQQWLGLLGRELEHGALGIGVLLGYAPQSDPEEYLAVAHLAARAGVPTFTHVREIVESDPSTPIDGSEELARAAGETGAHMHHCHVNSTSRRHIDRVLTTLDTARRNGAPVTVEAYPYGAGSTAIGAAFLAPTVLESWGLTPERVVMLGSGERVGSERRLLELREHSPAALCIIEFLDERDPVDALLLRRSLEFDDAMVASDAVPVQWPDGSRDTRRWPLPPGGVTHPRTAGTFARALRMMVGTDEATGVGSTSWTWVEAFRRCSYLPARVLDAVTTQMAGKGRLNAGTDADLVVLDPAAVRDRADYRDPTRTSSGVRHLLVNGEFVIRDGALRADAYPGRAVRGR